MSIVWVTSTGPSHRANKLGVIRWMGTSIARVDFPHVKSDGQKGGNLPGSTGRRRRGSRGTREGRARGGKPRSRLARRASLRAERNPANRTASEKKEARAIRASKARSRRGAWISGKFESLAQLVLDSEVKGGTDTELWSSFWKDSSSEFILERKRFVFRLRVKDFSRNLRLKKCPAGPFARANGAVDVFGWFQRFWEMKYGTWDDVSWLSEGGNALLGPMGRLTDGFHRYPVTVLHPDEKSDSRPTTSLTSRAAAIVSNYPTTRGKRGSKARQIARGNPRLRGARVFDTASGRYRFLPGEIEIDD